MPNIYIGLVHYPVYNKELEQITSGITNLDIHDISRTAMTFNIVKYFLIHPNERQKEIFDKIIGFWKSDIAAFYNSHRVDALNIISFAKSINDAVNMIKNQEENDLNDPIVITTTAKHRENQISFENTKKLIHSADNPFLILFGTGNGLHDDVHQFADYVLQPIQGNAMYNHLSVRSAVAIVLDRLFSEEYRRK